MSLAYDQPPASPASPAASDDVAARHLELGAAVHEVCAVRVDELSDAEIAAELEALEPARRSLDARIGRLTSALTRRRARRARVGAGAGDDGDRVAERAARRARRELADELGWSPQQARAAERDGQRLESLPLAGSAADAGQLSSRHARVLAETLEPLDGPLRAALEAELVEAATTQDPVTFGRTARRRVAEVAPHAAADDERARHANRRASVSQGDDGMLRVHGQWTGVDAETIATAVEAFRRPDRPGQLRSAEQRTADALVDVARAALDAGEAPTDRGVRPHLTITVPIGVLHERAGVAEGERTGPIPYDALRAVLDDAGYAWLVTDDGGLPLEAGAESRHVPAGLWRLLRERDRGCIAEGCDQPASRCDVMHLDVPFAAGGRLTPQTAALGCRTDHTRYDDGRLELHWDDDRPILRPPTADPDTVDSDRPRDGPAP